MHVFHLMYIDTKIVNLFNLDLLDCCNVILSVIQC